MILYRYFKKKEDRNLWLQGNGRIYFSPIENFSDKSCNNSRRDELENSVVYPETAKIYINGEEVLCKNLKINDDVIGNFISCFSLELSDNLKKKLGQYVLRFDSYTFLEFLDSNSFDGLSFKYGKIEYTKHLNQYPSSPFRKLKSSITQSYEDEKEFRILMKIPSKSKIENLEINNLKHIPFELEGLKEKFLML